VNKKRTGKYVVSIAGIGKVGEWRYPKTVLNVLRACPIIDRPNLIVSFHPDPETGGGPTWPVDVGGWSESQVLEVLRAMARQ
jgi:hypothetical protein